MNPLKLVAMVLAVACFILYAMGVSPPRGNFLGVGLAFWAIGTML